jgi:hypothetical protein
MNKTHLQKIMTLKGTYNIQKKKKMKKKRKTNKKKKKK